MTTRDHASSSSRQCTPQVCHLAQAQSYSPFFQSSSDSCTFHALAYKQQQQHSRTHVRVSFSLKHILESLLLEHTACSCQIHIHTCNIAQRKLQLNLRHPPPTLFTNAQHTTCSFSSSLQLYGHQLLTHLQQIHTAGHFHTIHSVPREQAAQGQRGVRSSCHHRHRIPEEDRLQQQA